MTRPAGPCLTCEETAFRAPFRAAFRAPFRVAFRASLDLSAAAPVSIIVT